LKIKQEKYFDTYPRPLQLHSNCLLILLLNPIYPAQKSSSTTFKDSAEVMPTETSQRFSSVLSACTSPGPLVSIRPHLHKESCLHRNKDQSKLKLLAFHMPSAALMPAVSLRLSQPPLPV